MQITYNMLNNIHLAYPTAKDQRLINAFYQYIISTSN